jgi:hypothetical protein
LLKILASLKPIDDDFHEIKELPIDDAELGK